MFKTKQKKNKPSFCNRWRVNNNKNKPANCYTQKQATISIANWKKNKIIKEKKNTANSLVKIEKGKVWKAKPVVQMAILQKERKIKLTRERESYLQKVWNKALEKVTKMKNKQT